MRMPSGLARACLVCAILAATPASAENRTFLLASNSDGYGLDRCLRARETCGTTAGDSYCRSRAYLQAVSFRMVARKDMTGTARDEGLACRGGQCGEVIAIECMR